MPDSDCRGGPSETMRAHPSNYHNSKQVKSLSHQKIRKGQGFMATHQCHRCTKSSCCQLLTAATLL